MSQVIYCPDLDYRHLQQQEEHWAIVDLVGKGGHIRTVRYQNGLRRPLISGPQRPVCPAVEYSDVSAAPASIGATA